MTEQRMSIGISPCPNDTFIFYGLLNGKVKAEGIVFDHVFEDVETLNKMAVHGKLDITKISFHALGYVMDEYALLRTGGALGKGCGPLIVAREKRPVASLKGRSIAVPGGYTTAFLLLKLFDPLLANEAVPMPFHEIMGAVRDGTVEAGVIIHEGRFTYPLYDLVEIMDLGQWWEDTTSCPIPLGAIVARRRFGGRAIRTIEAAIRQSILYAHEHGEETMSFIRSHAQEMDSDVINRHIGLYVNEFSEDLGTEGIKAVETLFRMADEKGVFGRLHKPLFPENRGGR